MKRVFKRVFILLECAFLGHRWKVKKTRDHTDLYFYRECEICKRTEFIGEYDA